MPTFDEFRTFLHSLERGEIDAYREASRAYLASEEFDPFHKGAFVERFRRLVAEEAEPAI